MTAFSRRDAYPVEHPNLMVLVGSTQREDDVASAIEGKDIIVSALGNRDYTDPTLVVYPAMLSVVRNIRPSQRLISIGAPSVLQHDSTSLERKYQDPNISWFVRFPLVDHYATLELFLHDHYIEHEANWTMVCPPLIVDGEADGEYLVAATFWPQGAGKKLSAGNIADFIVKEIRDKTFEGQRVGIGSK